MKLRRRIAGLGLLGMVCFAPGVWAQGAGAKGTTATTLVTPRDVGATTLLPNAFGGWTADASASVAAPEPAMSLVSANHAALQECAPQRSQTATYIRAGRALRVEAVQFADFTGAWSAYTLLREPGLRDAKDLGAFDAVGKDAVLFVSGTVVAVAYPAGAADVAGLKALDAALPKAHGNPAQPPLLPTFLPAKALADGSVRYALGQTSYQGEGGALPAANLGWDKSAEALTATYKDRRGDETLTLLLYPTPQIAEAHLKSIKALLPGLGAAFANASARREAELVMVANGSFSPEATAAFLAGIHMRQQAAFDRASQLTAANGPDTNTVVHQTASLLVSIAVLFGILASGAVLLGIFLGGGRALVRKLQGKDAAADVEFLSLHLSPQNAAPRFGPTE